MPFVQPIKSQVFPVMYNVEQAVGPQSPNKQGDVRLVQYMLKHYYKTQQISVDGWIGPITSGFIKQFQSDMAKAGNSVFQDGRIDRAFGKTSSVSKTIYTILMLNFALKKGNPAAFAQIPQQIKMNPQPAANPYNPVVPAPAPPVVRYVTVETTSQGMRVTEVYETGNVSLTVVYTIPYFA